MRLALIAAALLTGAIPLLAAPPAGVFSPTQGVLCDRPAGFCADGTGVSASWTQQYLGAAAAHQLSQKMLGSPRFDESVFTLSNRVRCSVQAQVCTRGPTGNEIEAKATRVLFGKLPPAAKPREDIERR